MKSIVQKRGSVDFPEFIGERVYMREFYKSDGLPSDLARWQSTIDAMLEDVDTSGPLYLMIDQGAVLSAGDMHRRGGLHIDGYWIPAKKSHGGGHHPSISEKGGHSYRNRDGQHLPTMPSNGSHNGGRNSCGIESSWSKSSFNEKEGLLLASNVQACRAFIGDFDGNIGNGGDCSAIDISHMQEIPFEANFVYAGNVTMLHESLPMPFACNRTLVRINVPGWHP